MKTDTITLFSSGLLSKWGFHDGDLGWDEWLDYWEARGVDDPPGFPLVEFASPKSNKHRRAERCRTA